MQAIVETVFDAVYLVSVITIGILMIRGLQGQPPVQAVRSDGCRSGYRRLVPSDSPVLWLYAPRVLKTLPFPWVWGSGSPL